MTDKSKAEPSRRTSPDTLARTSEKGEIELKEEDLKKVTGGAGAAQHKGTQGSIGGTS